MPPLLAVLLAAVLPLSAGAAELEPHEVYLNGGILYPTAKTGFSGRAGDQGDRFGRLGPQFGLGYFRNVGRVFAVGAEVFRGIRGSYQLVNPLAAFPGSQAYVKGYSQAALAMVRIRAPGEKWRPYATAGVGIQQTQMEAFVRSAPGRVWVVNNINRGHELRYIYGQKSTWGGVARAGVERVLPKGGSVALEAGYFRTPTMSFPQTSDGWVLGTPDTVQASGSAFTLALKFGYSFGLKP